MEGLFQQWFRSGIIDTLEVIALFLEVGQAELSIFIADEQVSVGGLPQMEIVDAVVKIEIQLIVVDGVSLGLDTALDILIERTVAHAGVDLLGDVLHRLGVEDGGLEDTVKGQVKHEGEYRHGRQMVAQAMGAFAPPPPDGGEYRGSALDDPFTGPTDAPF